MAANIYTSIAIKKPVRKHLESRLPGIGISDRVAVLLHLWDSSDDSARSMALLAITSRAETKSRSPKPSRRSSAPAESQKAVAA